MYVLTRSVGRRQKERGMRRRRLKRLWARLHELQRQKLTRDELLLKLGAAKADAGIVYRLVDVHVPKTTETVSTGTFTFSLRKEKLRAAIRNEGHYLLRSNLSDEDPAILWQRYIQLTEIEAVSAISKVIWPSAPSITRRTRASRLTSLYLFWPIVCMSPCSRGCGFWRQG